MIFKNEGLKEGGEEGVREYGRGGMGERGRREGREGGIRDYNHKPEFQRLSEKNKCSQG